MHKNRALHACLVGRILLPICLSSGAHRRKGTTDVQQHVKVKAIHQHSGFSMKSLRHDIAVLQLERPVELNDKVTTVCLPSKTPDLKANCYITGVSVSGFFSVKRKYDFMFSLISDSRDSSQSPLLLIRLGSCFWLGPTCWSTETSQAAGQVWWRLQGKIQEFIWQKSPLVRWGGAGGSLWWLPGRQWWTLRLWDGRHLVSARCR